MSALRVQTDSQLYLLRPSAILNSEDARGVTTLAELEVILASATGLITYRDSKENVADIEPYAGGPARDLTLYGKDIQDLTIVPAYVPSGVVELDPYLLEEIASFTQFSSKPQVLGLWTRQNGIYALQSHRIAVDGEPIGGIEDLIRAFDEGVYVLADAGHHIFIPPDTIDKFRHLPIEIHNGLVPLVPDFQDYWIDYSVGPYSD